MAFKKESERDNTMLLSIKQFEILDEKGKPKTKASIVRSSTQAREGYIKAQVYNPTTKEKEDKYFLCYEEIEGFIESVEWFNREIKKTGQRMMGIDLHIVDEHGEKATLSLPYGRAVFQKFCYVAENIDFSKPVAFRAWLGFDGIKKKEETVFNVKQDEKGLKHVYTKENPGELPSAVKSPTTGKWSFDAHNDWLVKRIQEVVAPKAEAAAAKRGPVKQQPTQQVPNGQQAEIDRHDEPDWGNDPWAQDDDENATTATSAPKLTPQERGKQLFEQKKVTVNPKTRNYTVNDPDFDEPTIVWRDDKQVNQCTCNPGRPDNNALKCQHLIAVNWFYADSQKKVAA